MFKNLKSRFGLNFFAVLGYLPFVFFLYDFFTYDFKYIGIGIWIYGLIQGCLITLSLVVWVIELFCKHEIHNKYILENKTYNIIWLTGFISSCLCFLFFLYEVSLGTLQVFGYFA